LTHTVYVACFSSAASDRLFDRYYVWDEQSSLEPKVTCCW